jgi:hypothetical protein
VESGAPSATFPPPPPTTVSYDLVAMLVHALNARGMHYAPVAITNNFTVAAPGLFPGPARRRQVTRRTASSGAPAAP